MIPKKNEVIQKARELYVEHCYKSGTPELADVNPEDSELVESGFYSSALSSLMTSEKRKYAEYMNGSEDLPIEPFSFNVSEAMQTTTFISGSRGVGKSDVSMRIVDQLTSEGIICVAFDSSMDWLKRSSISRYVTIKPYSDLKIPDQNTIIDMSMLTPNQQQAIVERFCEKLFQHQIETQCGSRFYVVFEESQIFFPLNSLRSKNAQNSMRILTIGRNINTSICAISQFPSLIDKELVKNAQQIYIGTTSETNAVQYWRGILGKNADQLKDLQNGEFFYYCRNKLGKIQIEAYESQTPKTHIAIPQPTLTPIAIKQNNNAQAISSLIVAFMWFFAIVLALQGRGLL
jgi:hypothetical protein